MTPAGAAFGVLAMIAAFFFVFCAYLNLDRNKRQPNSRQVSSEPPSVNSEIFEGGNNDCGALTI